MNVVDVGWRMVDVIKASTIQYPISSVLEMAEKRTRAKARA